MSRTFDQAQAAAATTAVLPFVESPLGECLGLVLAADLTARSDLPSFDSSAMDGWAVCGAPPWVLGTAILAGHLPGSIAPGQAVPIATGAALPTGADAVLRRELGLVEGRELQGPRPPQGQDIRSRGSECRAGEVVAPAGLLVRPAVLGLAAASGADTLLVVRRPTVEVLILGDELLVTGPARAALVRDAIGPLLPGWLSSLGAAVLSVSQVPDTAQALLAAVLGSTADLVLTTGSTARGPADHLHAALAAVHAELVVDGVAVRPGQPMLLARLADGRTLIGLPGNPLAAVSGLVTLVEPTLAAMRGAPPAVAPMVVLQEAVIGHPTDVRLIPVRGGSPVHHIGPAMLRGLAVADALIVVPPGGAAAQTRVRALHLP